MADYVSYGRKGGIQSGIVRRRRALARGMQPSPRFCYCCRVQTRYYVRIWGRHVLCLRCNSS